MSARKGLASPLRRGRHTRNGPFGSAGLVLAGGHRAGLAFPSGAEPSPCHARGAELDLAVGRTRMVVGPVTLRGRHVTLEPLDGRRAPGIFEAMQDEEVCRYFAWPPPAALDETRAFIRDARDSDARPVRRLRPGVERDRRGDRLDAIPRHPAQGPAARDRQHLPRPRLLADAREHRGQVPAPAPCLRIAPVRPRRTQSGRPQHALAGSHRAPGRGAGGRAPEAHERARASSATRCTSPSSRPSGRR